MNTPRPDEGVAREPVNAITDRLDQLGYKPVARDHFECTGCQTRYPSINGARMCCRWDNDWD